MPFLGPLVVVAGVALAAVFVGSAAEVTYGFPLDDAWIHLVYARAISVGDGYAYNPGQLETGATSPLWALVLAIGAASSAHHEALVLFSKGLGMVAHVATAILGARLLHFLEVRRAIVWGAALFLALDPFAMLGALSGMEVALCSLLLVWMVGSIARDRHAQTMIALTLLPLVRPEALLVTLATTLLQLRVRGEGLSFSRRVTLICAPWIGAASWSVYCLIATGRLMSSTFYVKASSTPSTWLHNVYAVPATIHELGVLRFGVGALLLALGMRAAWRGKAAAATSSVARRAPVLMLLMYVAAVFVSQPLKEPGVLYWMRYLMPVVPLATLIAAFGLDDLVSRTTWGARHGTAVLVSAALVFSFACFTNTQHAVAHYQGSCRNLAQTHVPIAAYLREHTAPTDWIATHDAGVIRFLSDRPVLDLVGLNNHRVARGELAAELRRTQARYFVVFPATFPMADRDPRFQRILSRHADNYVISSAPQSDLVLYRFEP